jgi:hypothetical protein
MNKQFIQVTNGMLPVAVLVLLAIALIAGQARANFENDDLMVSNSTVATDTGVKFNAEMLKKAETLPHVMDAIVNLPAEFELTIRLRGKASKAERRGPGH